MSNSPRQDSYEPGYNVAVGIEPMVSLDSDGEFEVTDHDGTPLIVVSQGGRNVGSHYHRAARPEDACLFDLAPPPEPRCSAPLYDEEKHYWKYKRPEHVVFRDLCSWCERDGSYASNGSNAVSDKEADHV